jgi:glucose/arabinose dehydrogenase
MTDHPFRGRAALALASFAVAFAFFPDAAHAQTMPAGFTVTPLLPNGSLSQPTSMAFLPNGEILVLEKANGRVRRVVGTTLSPTIALDVNVNFSSERGLLGIAILDGSPIRVFLYYTEAQGADGGTPLGNRVYRYDWSPGTGTLINPQLVLDLPVTPGPNHDGGNILLDTQGRLYAFIGDLNRNGQNQNFPAGPAPDDTGVIFRVNQDGTAAAGNPFTPYCSVTTSTTCTTSANCPGGETCQTQVARYLAYGVRNSFGMTFDPVTGRLWETENGANDMDEINLITPGMNGGWEQIMGPDALDPQGIGDLFHMPGAGITYSDPEFSWQNVIAPTAILFPVATTWGTAFNDRLIVGANNTSNIYSFPLNPARDGFDFSAFPALQDLVANNGTETNLLLLGSGFGVPTDFEKGPDDNVYVVSLGNGTIYRIAGPVPVTIQDFRVE